MLNIILTLLALAAQPTTKTDQIQMQPTPVAPAPQASSGPEFKLLVVPAGTAPSPQMEQKVDASEETKIKLDGEFRKAGWECEVTATRRSQEETRRAVSCMQTLGPDKKSLAASSTNCPNTSAGRNYTTLNLGVGGKTLKAGVTLVLACVGGGGE